MLAVCLVMVAGILNLSAQQTDSIKVTKQPLTADSITQIVMADTAVVLPVFADTVLVSETKGKRDWKTWQPKPQLRYKQEPLALQRRWHWWGKRGDNPPTRRSSPPGSIEPFR